MSHLTVGVATRNDAGSVVRQSLLELQQVPMHERHATIQTSARAAEITPPVFNWCNAPQLIDTCLCSNQATRSSVYQAERARNQAKPFLSLVQPDL
eukprot:2361645-Amphidinium_carterae.1